MHHPLSKRLQKRQKIVEEIVASERLYYKFLAIMTERFLLPLKSILTPTQIEAIFSNIEQIAPFHKIIAYELEQNPAVSKVFLKYVSYLKLYQPYVNNYERALKTISDLKSEKQFQKVIMAIILADADATQQACFLLLMILHVSFWLKSEEMSLVEVSI